MNDISEKKSYRLVSGSFSPESARQVLLALVNHKINFHELNDWSHRERFGKDNPATVKRVKELKRTREEILKMLEGAAATGLKLRINSDIEIELMPE